MIERVLRRPRGSWQYSALLLSLCNALSGSVGPIAFGLGALAGESLLSDEAVGLAALPISGFVVGSAMAAAPIALLMKKVGRRPGFVIGALLGASGAALCSLALLANSFWTFVGSMMVLGSGAAFIQQYRYAAADAADTTRKDKAISLVMAGGVVSGVLGPVIAINARVGWLASEFAGPFFILAALFISTVPLLSLLQVPLQDASPDRPRVGRSLLAIISQPRFLIATLITNIAYASMSLVMTATPLAMVWLCGHSIDDAQTGILLHVLAMFGPSFFTGHFIAVFGRSAVAGVGLALMATAAAIAFLGSSLLVFWTVFVLLGIGWNFSFTAGTGMITEHYGPDEAAKTQGFSETVLFVTVALTTMASGALVTSFGWLSIIAPVIPSLAGGFMLLVAEEFIRLRGKARSEPDPRKSLG